MCAQERLTNLNWCAGQSVFVAHSKVRQRLKVSLALKQLTWCACFSEFTLAWWYFFLTIWPFSLIWAFLSVRKSIWMEEYANILRLTEKDTNGRQFFLYNMSFLRISFLEILFFEVCTEKHKCYLPCKMATNGKNQRRVSLNLIETLFWQVFKNSDRKSQKLSPQENWKKNLDSLTTPIKCWGLHSAMEYMIKCQKNMSATYFMWPHCLTGCSIQCHLPTEPGCTL